MITNLHILRFLLNCFFGTVVAYFSVTVYYEYTDDVTDYLAVIYGLVVVTMLVGVWFWVHITLGGLM